MSLINSVFQVAMWKHTCTYYSCIIAVSAEEECANRTLADVLSTAGTCNSVDWTTPFSIVCIIY